MREPTENQRKKEQKRKAQRTFPIWNTILLIVIVVAQIGLIRFGIRYQPKAQDLIHAYNVTVQPLEDGSLDITYELLWEALDSSEPLTWVEIGMANENFSIYEHSISSNVLNCERYVEEDYVSVRVLFRDSYIGGETVKFSFTVNQKDMLCKDEQGYFYEFVPGWFNEVEVLEYAFTWRMGADPDIVQQGHLSFGEYDILCVRYDAEAFAGCDTVRYRPFDDGGAYNGLKEDKTGLMVVCIMIAALLIFAEVYIVDCYVSYGRGRGFIVEYGTHVHVHGRTNPGYIRARQRHNRSSGGRSGGGGCACACACACAGGGRAGCSQKDTYATSKKRHNELVL